jgi:hypothetical protein
MIIVQCQQARQVHVSHVRWIGKELYAEYNAEKLLEENNSKIFKESLVLCNLSTCELQHYCIRIGTYIWMNEWMSVMKETTLAGEKLIPVPICLQVPHGLAWEWN